MKPGAVAISTCSTCGELLNVNGVCVVCLVREGLNAPREQTAAPHELRFGDFEIAQRDDGSSWELGCGAMGVTYRAIDKVLHRNVALKVIEAPETEGNSTVVRERFLREARSAAALRHPNIAGIFQFGASPEINRCYYAMELVEGETLEARVRRDGPLKVEAALEMANQVARALVAAAAQGLIHRDLKPGNIMLTHSASDVEEIEVKVIDFGLAKTTNAVGQMDLTHGAFVGTPTFASPEQFSRGPVDARSDIYSLGVTLWYALTGDVPYPGKTIEEIRDRQTSADLPIKQLTARKIPNPVIQLLRFTLAVDPLKRPASARELTESIESCHRKLASILPNRSATTRNRRKLLAFVGASVIAAAALLTYSLTQRKPASLVSDSARLSEKSIAVLPFENLSKDEENIFFADGLQDDVLTSLAKVGELKVISRTSASHYRGTSAARNLRVIARELGVQNILEGSVRREGNRVLVNVQLIDATEDRHLWAEHYDCSLSDLIGLHGELATQIAATLKAKLAPEEKARVQFKVTDNPDAYVRYLMALKREGMVNASTQDKISAEQLYMQATTIAPTFALAYARASLLNSELAIPAGEEDPEHQAKARAQADEALRLAPSLGEAHMALGLCLYWGEKDYFAALKEFFLAATASPNDADILYYISGIYRRQGRWRESIASLQHAQDLDPRNHRIAIFAAHNYLVARDWSAATAAYNRALEIAPDSAEARIGLAYLEVFRNGTLASGRVILAKVPKSADPNGRATEARWDFAMLERDFAAADTILKEVALETFPDANGLPKSFFEGRIARARGDTETAQRCLRAVASTYESWTSESSEAPSKHETLGLLYAYLGRKRDAIREGRRALEMEPESQNAFHGAARAATLALIYALVGEADQAIPLVDRLLATPGPAQTPNFPQNITLADLRLRWEWDSLRSDPRFQKILAGPEPKTIY